MKITPQAKRYYRQSSSSSASSSQGSTKQTSYLSLSDEEYHAPQSASYESYDTSSSYSSDNASPPYFAPAYSPPKRPSRRAKQVPKQQACPARSKLFDNIAVYPFDIRKKNMPPRKKSKNTPSCYEHLFFSFPSPSQPTAPPSKTTPVSPSGVDTDTKVEKDTEKKTVSLDDMKKVVLRRKLCRNLTCHWTPELFDRYQFDKADWHCLMLAWQTDALNKDLLFGTVMTEDDYQRINCKDKKRLLMLFHPDKNRIDKPEALYGIIFKKINKFYTNYQNMIK